MPIVWIPKYRKKVLYGQQRKEVVEILRTLLGNLNGKSALMLYDRHPEWRCLIGKDRTFWARGYYVSTVGLNIDKLIPICL